MYIMNCTRPDIACAISELSRYTSNPNKTHWMAMKRVLGYLKYTQNYTLHYNKYPAVLEAYRDANWIIGSNKVKFTSGYVFTIGSLLEIIQTDLYCSLYNKILIYHIG